eukprot:3966725-Amphidinium_carterae.1
MQTCFPLLHLPPAGASGQPSKLKAKQIASPAGVEAGSSRSSAGRLGPVFGRVGWNFGALVLLP